MRRRYVDGVNARDALAFGVHARLGFYSRAVLPAIHDPISIEDETKSEFVAGRDPDPGFMSPEDLANTENRGR